MIISHASIPNLLMYDNEYQVKSKTLIQKSITESFAEILRVFKPSGIVYMAPVSISSNTETERIFSNIVQQVLSELEDTSNFEVTFKKYRDVVDPDTNEIFYLYRLKILKK